MSWPVTLSALAERDIAEAFVRYEMEKEGLGLRFVSEVEEAVERIAQNPLVYRIVIDDIRRACLDKFPYALWFTMQWIAPLSSRGRTTNGTILNLPPSAPEHASRDPSFSS